MNEKDYYNKINNIVEELEINTKIREIKTNQEKVLAYWNIGKLIVEAQGGKERAKYGDELIKKWSIKFCTTYGNNYSERLFRRIRQFYILFPKWSALRTVSWTHIKAVLPIKNENERNYYLNQVILNNLSTREVEQLIKTKAFNRLSYADKENIKLICEEKDSVITINDMIKDPILIKGKKDIENFSEKLLHHYIIDMLENKFLELGMAFALVGHEYKISVENHTYRLDLLFFNIKLNSYVVVEVKTKNMKIKDIDQLKFYVSLVDKHLKEKTNNKTIGILIAKEHDNYVIKYATNEEIFTTTYQII